MCPHSTYPLKLFQAEDSKEPGNQPDGVPPGNVAKRGSLLKSEVWASRSGGALDSAFPTSPQVFPLLQVGVASFEEPGAGVFLRVRTLHRGSARAAGGVEKTLGD